MQREELSRTQRFILRFVDPQTAAATETHSRAWLLECPNCGNARSVWEMGGIRYKASGSSKTRVRCPKCGEAGWHRMVKAANFPTAEAPRGGLFKPILIITLLMLAIILLLVGAILLLVFWLIGFI